MGNLVFQATLGGQVNLVGPNTASTFNLNVPAVSATLATTAANTFTAVQTLTAGSASAPALTTTGDTNTGIFFPAADTIAFAEGGVEAMRLDASGNLGLTSGKFFAFDTAPSASNYALYGTSTQTVMNVGSGGALQFNINNSEKARIDSSGNLLVGDTSAVGKIYSYVNSSTLPAIHARQDGTAYIQSWVIAAGAMRAYIKTDGGLGNYSANNVNLSDERMKTDISLAGSYLAKICAIPVKTFKYKDQTDNALNLGVIAQDVEAIAPELVDTTGWGSETEQPEDGVPLKAIYQTDLQYALMKSIQELKAIVDAQAVEIAALKG